MAKDEIAALQATTKELRSAMDTSQFIGVNATAKAPSDFLPKSIETLKLNLETMSMQMKVYEKQISILNKIDETMSMEMKAYKKQISVLNEINEEKTREIAALQATTEFLMKKSQSFAKAAESTAASATALSHLPAEVARRETFLLEQHRSRMNFEEQFLELQEMQRVSQEEIQSLKDAGAAPDLIRALFFELMRAKKRAAEQSLMLAMAANESTGITANAADQPVASINLAAIPASC